MNYRKFGCENKATTIEKVYIYGYPEIVIEKIINASDNRDFEILLYLKESETFEIIHPFQWAAKLSYLL